MISWPRHCLREKQFLHLQNIAVYIVQQLQWQSQCIGPPPPCALNLREKLQGAMTKCDWDLPIRLFCGFSVFMYCTCCVLQSSTVRPPLTKTSVNEVSDNEVDAFHFAVRWKYPTTKFVMGCATLFREFCLQIWPKLRKNKKKVGNFLLGSCNL